MATEVEEAVVDANVGDTEKLGPELCQLLFRLGFRFDEIAVELGPFEGCRLRLIAYGRCALLQLVEIQGTDNNLGQAGRERRDQGFKAFIGTDALVHLRCQTCQGRRQVVRLRLCLHLRGGSGLR